MKGIGVLMLKNAALYSTQLAEKFGESYYTDRMFHFNCGVNSKIPDFTPEAYKYKYAVVNRKGDLIGYISYEIDSTSHSAENFKLIQFKNKSIYMGANFRDIFDSLIANKGIKRIMINCASGSPFIDTFEDIFEKYVGYNHDIKGEPDDIVPYIESYRCTLHECIMDSHGEAHNGEIYEFLIRK